MVLSIELIEKYPDAEFLGFVHPGEELDNLIKHARAIIVPSECNENCSMSVLEAMSFARPIVGSRIGGIPEQIRDGVDGALFEPGNAQQLADILDDLAINPEKAQRMGLNAHDRLCGKYAMRDHLQALLNLYQELLSKS